jgi:pimeloyl-ACP methyl ester carboxylesterase
LDRVAAVVLLAPVPAAVPNPTSLMERLRLAPDFGVDLARSTGLLARGVERSVREEARTLDLAVAEEVDRSTCRIAARASRRASRAMLLSFLSRAPDGRFDRERGCARRAEYGRVRIPALVVCGTCDLAVPSAAVERLAAALAEGRFVSIRGAGHSLSVFEPDAVASFARRFAAERGRGWPRRQSVDRGVGRR